MTLRYNNELVSEGAIKDSEGNKISTTYAKSADLATVATTGDYDDLTNKPTIPAAQVQSDWNQSDSTAVDFIKNKPTIPSGVIVDQTYDGTSTNAQSGIAIEGELTTNYQSKLVSGTNIKTVNNTSLLGSGNIDTSEVFVAEFGVTSYADIQTALSNNKVIIGYNDDTKEYYNYIGVKNHQSIGTCYAFSNIYGDTNTQSDVKNSVFYRSVSFWATHSSILETTSNKVTTISSSSTDTQYPSAKCVYDELTDKADTSLSNLTSTGQKVIDGQWVYSLSQLGTSTSIDNYTIDLNTYLPNIDGKYEVLLWCYNYNTNSSNSNLRVWSDIITSLTSGSDNLCWLNASSNSRFQCAYITMPVTRYLYYSIEGHSANDCRIVAMGYRRIGTNN